MTIVLVIAAAMLLVAAALLLVRMTLGPTILDRSVALDVLVAVTVSTIGLLIAHTRVTYALPVLVVLAAFGMVGAVSVARYASRSEDVDADSRPDEQIEGDLR
ncbi:monovalent cation/H+ antiporter complex subunit F [Nocardioides hwasunensis]|uniref:Cation:proton antiporter n=1 Tax=Nocardioides hwasunensis TaxID=397258 RepID=A0ABR8MC63_9ACTN|nr:monovalent cation/H+ antiporter complex subunit F [Nocardioides hwasunensis]MBD3913730.1 cation:proton antiporter [Nocardioides hwasunensis]